MRRCHEGRGKDPDFPAQPRRLIPFPLRGKLEPAHSKRMRIRYPSTSPSMKSAPTARRRRPALGTHPDRGERQFLAGPFERRETRGRDVIVGGHEDDRRSISPPPTAYFARRVFERVLGPPLHVNARKRLAETARFPARSRDGDPRSGSEDVPFPRRPATRRGSLRSSPPLPVRTKIASGGARGGRDP